VPILKEGELDIITHSAEQTARLGTRLGTLLQAGDVICLSGDMGAGKTVFSAGLGRGWGSSTPMSSPTFNLVHQHARQKDDVLLYHLDCYRLKTEDDVESIGLEDILAAHACVVFEWPEAIEKYLPAERLWINLGIMEALRRNLVFRATGKRYEHLLSQFRGMTYG
jgi:tRNA threonylcarbamoyladenosine biosynthesis protein TsaE